MSSRPHSTPSDSSLYRRVWRWHFYAGLVCLPFLALMALTGALYLFKGPIESLLYGHLRFVDSTAAPALDAETLVARAADTVPGQPIRYVAAGEPGRSTEVGIRTPHGTVSVFLDPVTAEPLGQLRNDSRPMELVKRLHSLSVIGPLGNAWTEIVAGWAIVLVASGVFLWWPRGRSSGVYTVRGRPSHRTWWRDLHAITGVLAAAAILFLAVTGMPWSTFWGKQFGRLTNEWGIGLPQYLFGPAPPSSPPLASLGEGPWTLTQATMPASEPHAQHDAGQESKGAAEPRGMAAGPSIGLNEALRIFMREGMPAGVPVSLPIGPRGAYTAMLFPDDARAQRVVHLDRYSGAVLADVGYDDYGVAGRMVEWGVNLHTGRQFGLINQLVMLCACLSILGLAATAVVMWWKRRPHGRLAAPPRRNGDRVALSALAVAALLGLLYPLLGASMLVACLVDTLVPRRWHERFGL